MSELAHRGDPRQFLRDPFGVGTRLQRDDSIRAERGARALREQRQDRGKLQDRKSVAIHR
jgi:hypothetical protein